MFLNSFQRGGRGLSCSTAGNSNCNCPELISPSQVLGTTTEVLAARPVQAMLQSVIDSCCQTDDVTQEISLPCPGIFNCNDLEIGTILDVELDGDITFREVKRDKEDCNCLSSVRFQIPIKLSPLNDCSCSSSSVSRVITVIRTVDLCCTKDSMLLAANSKVLSANAWITDIYPDHIKVYISLTFRSCLQQTVMQIYEFSATPVCTYPNCNEVRNSFVDNCDLICGCTAGAKTCPSCS